MESQDKWQKIRNLRNSFLQSSDVYIFSDRWERYDQNTKNLWIDYRQKLRDLPINFTNPNDVVSVAKRLAVRDYWNKLILNT